MDRILFATSIGINVPIEVCIKEYFDEIMVLYDLMYSYKDFMIYGDIENSIITFRIECDNSIIDRLKELLNNRSICKYNKQFICIAENVNDSLSIKLAS